MEFQAQETRQITSNQDKAKKKKPGLEIGKKSVVRNGGMH